MGGVAGNALQAVGAVVEIEGRLVGFDDEGDEGPSLIRDDQAAVVTPVGAAIPVVAQFIIAPEIKAEVVLVALEDEACKAVLVSVSIEPCGISDGVADDRAVEQSVGLVAGAIELEGLLCDEGIGLQLGVVEVGGGVDSECGFGIKGPVREGVAGEVGFDENLPGARFVSIVLDGVIHLVGGRREVRAHWNGEFAMSRGNGVALLAVCAEGKK